MKEDLRKAGKDFMEGLTTLGEFRDAVCFAIADASLPDDEVALNDLASILFNWQVKKRATAQAS